MSTALRRDRRTIAKRTLARSVVCPRCGADVGKPCINWGKQTAWEHADRGLARWYAERERGA